MSDERETLTPRQRTARTARAERAKLDIQHLWAQPQFQRFIFTVLDHAPMFGGAYGSDGRHLHYAEGRRSLGFDIIRTIERSTGTTGVLAQILAAEDQTQTEAPNGGRKYQRLSDLDDGSGRAERDFDRPVFLDYGGNPEG